MMCNQIDRIIFKKKMYSSTLLFYTLKSFVVPLLTQLAKMLNQQDVKLIFFITVLRPWGTKKTVEVTMLKNQSDKYFCRTNLAFSF